MQKEEEWKKVKQFENEVSLNIDCLNVVRFPGDHQDFIKMVRVVNIELSFMDWIFFIIW